MKCRLTSGKEPTVTFLWFHNGKPVKKGPDFKIKTRKSGSVLNIRGLPETAGRWGFFLFIFDFDNLQDITPAWLGV